MAKILSLKTDKIMYKLIERLDYATMLSDIPVAEAYAESIDIILNLTDQQKEYLEYCIKHKCEVNYGILIHDNGSLTTLKKTITIPEGYHDK